MNSTHDSTRDALYTAILAHPDEDTPRLAYADHIEEFGDPARAEFIRVQCRIANMNEWDEGFTAADVRCRRLLAERPEWTDAVLRYNADFVRQPGSLRAHRGCGPHSVFVRGFPELVGADAGWFARNHRDLFATFPIRAVGLALEEAEAREALVDCPGLARLTSLGVSMWYEEGAGFDALARLRHTAGLKRLEMYAESVAAGAFERFLLAPQFAALEAFTLGSDSGDYEPRQPEHVLQGLDRGSWLFGLKSLALDGNVFQGLGERLARDTNWEPRLERLALRSYMGYYGEIAPEAVARVGEGVRSGWFDAVEDLDLSICDFEGLVTDSLSTSGARRPARLALPKRNRTGYQRGLQAKSGLLCSDWVSELRSLSAAGVGEVEVRELLGSRLPQRLRVLDLSSGNVTAAALRELLAAPGGWPLLERLDLSGSALSDGALVELVHRLDRFPRLVSLAVGKYEPLPQFLTAVAESPAAARLRELNVSGSLTASAASALARSPQLEEIDLLRVEEGGAGHAVVDRVRKRFGARLTVDDQIPF